MSVAQSSETTGSITTFAPAGTWRDHPRPGQVARVGPREHGVVVDDGDEALGEHHDGHDAPPAERAGSAGRGSASATSSTAP